VTNQIWDGTTRSTHLSAEGVQVRQRLANVAKNYDWHAVFDILHGHSELVNSARPDGRSRYAPLHQAAHGGAPVHVVKQLIAMGAWRGLREAKDERPIDIAKRRGHGHLLGVLEPPDKTNVPSPVLDIIQERFHAVIRGRSGTIVKRHRIRLPDLEVLRELERPQLWFPMPFMRGGFWFHLEPNGRETKLISLSWSRAVERSERRHEITANGTLEQTFPEESRDMAHL
jgi:hypothetical protein